MQAFSNVLRRHARHLRELFVIFLSIVLAFFFEDYREAKNEKSQYLETLAAFRLELIGELESKRNVVDSFRIARDIPYRGEDFARLQVLNWLDTLITSRQATMAHFRYVFSTGVFDTKLYGAYAPSSHAVELRTHYQEHIQSDDLERKLKIYEQEMTISLRLREVFEKYADALSAITRDADPDLQFTATDSLLFYSNRFIWAYRDLLHMRQSEYLYNSWLAYDRLFKVLEVVNQELEWQGQLPANAFDCLDMRSFQSYIECQKGRALTPADSLESLSKLVEQYRIRFLERATGSLLAVGTVDN